MTSTLIGTNPPFGFSIDSIRSKLRQGIPGSPVSVDPAHDIESSGVGYRPAAARVETVTVGDKHDSEAYQMILDGVTTVTYTSDSTATIDEIVTGLTAAWNNDGTCRGVAAAVADLAANTITVTGIWPGVDFTVTVYNAHTDLTVASTTAAAGSEDIAFDRCVFSAAGISSDPKTPSIFNAKTSYFTAQVATLDYTYNSGQTAIVEITDRHSGLVYRAEALMTSDKTTSTDLLVAEINRIMPAYTVVASNKGASGYELVLTAEVAGYEFAVNFSAGLPATTLPVVTATTGPSASTSILRCLFGWALYSDMVAAQSIASTSAYYEGGRMVRVGRKMDILTANTQSVSAGDAVYIEMDGTGANFGKPYNTASATRVRLPASVAQWKYTSSPSADGLAVFQADFTIRF